MKGNTYMFQGIKRDSHPIKQDEKFLWDAHNIRLTTRDGDTMLSITNEKSTRELYSLHQYKYIGHCVLGEYLVLFLHNFLQNRDEILRYTFASNSLKTLFVGDLGFSSDHPIQAIGDFESELIQKVYWVDGKNPPRMINITKPELLQYSEDSDWTSCWEGDDPFSFVQELPLTEKVNIERAVGGSSSAFPSGVIQYALTYYNKYGQESNIFYVSPLMYISYSDRGASPEDSVNTSFKLTISGLAYNFDYLRIYSIIRTSVDATPTVKRVADITLSGINSVEDVIIYEDDGSAGDIVDPQTLLYVGGKDVTAGCIAVKDGTLFLGDITYNRPEVRSLLPNNFSDMTTIQCNRRQVKFKNSGDSSSTNSFYRYRNQLEANTQTFKIGETYRLGVQFQYKTGEWSEPVFIKDEVMTGVRPYGGVSQMALPVFRSIPEWLTAYGTETLNKLKEAGYKKVRPLIAVSNVKDRTILAQGIICPTVFNVGNREGNSPFVQSSWLLRPSYSATDTINDPIVTGQANEALWGSRPEFRHLYPLTTGFSSAAEIQNMFLDEGTATNNMADSPHSSDGFTQPTLESINQKLAIDPSQKTLYCVDQSILTFHSPDIEFNSSVSLSINSDSDLSVKIVGAIPFTSCVGDIDIQTSSVQINPDARGFAPRPPLRTTDGSRSLISGLYFEDSLVVDKGEQKFTFTKFVYPHMVHMWHRSGSLNNDCTRQDSSARTAVLSKKKISNIRFSNYTCWYDNYNGYSLTDGARYDTSEIQIFNSNEVSLLKIKDTNNKGGDISYYGNVDTLNPSYTKFRLVCGHNGDGALYEPEITLEQFYITIFNGTSETTKSIDNVKVGSLRGNMIADSVNGIIITDAIIDIYREVTDENDSVTWQKESRSIKGAPIEFTYKELFDPQSPVNKTFTGYIVIADGYYKVRGGTNANLSTYQESTNIIDFNSSLQSVDPGCYDGPYVTDFSIGAYYEALKLPKDAVRIKYKSTPHAVFALQYDESGSRPALPIHNYQRDCPIKAINQFWLSSPNDTTNVYQYSLRHEYFKSAMPLNSTVNPNVLPQKCTYLWLAEIHQEVHNRYGGTTLEALRNNLWIPAGEAVTLGDPTAVIEWQWGDTWYQRYDCLKTYAFTPEDENQVVEIGSFMCECRVNMDGRYDRNRGLVSNLNVNPTNFNLINPVYSQMNTFFNYRIMDEDYYKVNSYPSQIVWTNVKSPASSPDSWTNLHLASTLDLDGTHGRVTAIQPFNDLLLGFQETSVSQILFNSRVQLSASDGTPIEIANSQKVEGARAYSTAIGCQDKFSLVSTPMGIYFIDNNNHSIYLFNGQLVNIGLQLGSLYWPRENSSDMTWRFDPSSTGNNGVRLYYDSKYQDVYFVPGSNYIEGQFNFYNREALCYSEQLGQFTSLMSYGGAVMFSHDAKFYSLARSSVSEELILWENFPSDSDDYNYIFGTYKPFSFSFISNEAPTITKVFDNIEFRADNYDRKVLQGSDLTHTNQTGQPFDYIRVDNEYQDSGEIPFNSSNLRKKFRVWRANIPRNSGTRQRIRNPWAKITLGVKTPNEKLSILHDLSVNYTI